MVVAVKSKMGQRHSASKNSEHDTDVVKLGYRLPNHWTMVLQNMESDQLAGIRHLPIVEVDSRCRE